MLVSSYFLLKGMAGFTQLLSVFLFKPDLIECFRLTVSDNLLLLFSFSKMVASHFLLPITLSEMFIEHSGLELMTQILH